MALWCIGMPEFEPNDKVVSLVYHLPEIEPGTNGVIVAPRMGSLYAVQLPNGELHRWFAEFELDPVNSGLFNWQFMNPGIQAKIKSITGHPSHIREGMVVKIVQAIGVVPFYELMIKGKLHRWLAEFELASANVVSQITY